jgi:hypothetical protein
VVKSSYIWEVAERAIGEAVCCGRFLTHLKVGIKSREVYKGDCQVVLTYITYEWVKYEIVHSTAARSSQAGVVEHSIPGFTRCVKFDDPTF